MTSLIRFNYGPFTKFEHLFDDAFILPLVTASAQHPDSFRPRMDVKESEDSNTVTATFELPGLKLEEISIELQQNRLTVSGERATSNDREGDGYTVRERRHGKFSRTLQLPLGTKPEDVKARLENGLLTLTFPKAVPEQEPWRITIQ